MVGLNAVEPATPAAASLIVAPSGARKVTSRNQASRQPGHCPHRPGGVSFLLQRSRVLGVEDRSPIRRTDAGIAS